MDKLAISAPETGLAPGLLREQAFIDGQWVGASSRETFDVVNPADGTVLAAVPRLSRQDTVHAIAAAQRAQADWSTRPAKERSVLLRSWFDAITDNREALARLLTAEQGKPLQEARGEIGYAAAFIEWFAEEGKRAFGETIPSHQVDQRIVVVRQAVGVCAAITPWNFPAAMITRKAGPALAAGCTMVIKPASQTPLTALALAALAAEAGLPPGVLNVVTGAASEVGEELITNPAVRKVSFTGSTEVGKHILARAAGTVKKVSMELGGNAPFIVFDDADLERAVEGVIASKFRNTGQTCVCANRIYVQRGVQERFAAMLVQRVAQLVVGDGCTEGVEQGPLIDRAAVRKVEQHVADALGLGAQLLLGGKAHARGGNFFQPTVLSNVDERMLVTQEETFGPVAPLLCFDTEDEVVQRANATPFGLAGYFYARDLGRAWRIAERLEVGMVGVNTGLISAENVPFGGIKESGIGREGSKVGLDEYLEMKYVAFAGIGGR